MDCQQIPDAAEIATQYDRGDQGKDIHGVWKPVDQLKEKVQSEIGATHVEFVDTSDGCGAKFSALVVAPQFEGMPLIKRHRLVHSAIEAEMKEIHALQIKALTPQQWEKLNP